MGFCIMCAVAALSGYIIGLYMGKKLSEDKIKKMRLEAGLDVETGEVNDEH